MTLFDGISARLIDTDRLTVNILERDGDDGMRRLCVVDAVRGRSLVQQRDEVHGAASAHRGGDDVPRPARGAHRTHRVMPPSAVGAAVHHQLAPQIRAVVLHRVAVDGEVRQPLDEVAVV